MRARREQIGDLGTECDHAAHGEATRHALGERDHVRLDPAGKLLTLEGEPGTGAANARLHFVNDQQSVVLGA